jgi:hypothetical protein
VLCVERYRWGRGGGARLIYYPQSANEMAQRARSLFLLGLALPAVG